MMRASIALNSARNFFN